MPKVNALFALSTTADGKAREGGKIYAVEQDTLTHLAQGGKAREATDEEVKLLGVTPEPELNAGQVARDLGKPVAAAPAVPAGETADKSGTKSKAGS